MRKRRYTCDFRFFQTIDSEIKAYWLGFIAADGYVLNGERRMLGITLSSRDRQHLEAFRQAIGATYPIEYREDVVQYKQYDHTTTLKSVKIRINDSDLVLDLDRLGVKPRKSLTAPFPTSDQVPDHLLHHFVRGYFDGDGSIWRVQSGRYEKWGVNVLAPDAFCERLWAVLAGKGVIAPPELHFVKHPKTNGMTYLSCFSQASMAAFGHYIYRDATICLTRKKDLFDQLPVPKLPDTLFARQQILQRLRETQDTMGANDLHQLLLKDRPDLKILTVHNAPREMTADGLIRLSHKVGKSKFYVYDFASSS